MFKRCCTIFFVATVFFSLESRSWANEEEQVLESTNEMRLVIPEHPLSKDALKIESSKSGQHFSDWTQKQHEESYALIKKVVAVWQKRGIEDYVVVGEEDPTTGFSWEVVPILPDENAVWKQMTVMRHVIFGRGELKKRDQGQAASCYKHASLGMETPGCPCEHACLGCDPFCRQDVIDLQKVIDNPDKSVRVLYDYKPLVYYHFLTVPKDHYEKFSDLPAKTYVEASEYAQKLLKQYSIEGMPFYLFHKSGRRAGQTVPHWHMHIVIPNSKSEELFGQCKALLKMVWGGSALDDDELKRRVEKLRRELN